MEHKQQEWAITCMTYTWHQKESLLCCIESVLLEDVKADAWTGWLLFGWISPFWNFFTSKANSGLSWRNGSAFFPAGFEPAFVIFFSLCFCLFEFRIYELNSIGRRLEVDRITLDTLTGCSHVRIDVGISRNNVQNYHIAHGQTIGSKSRGSDLCWLYHGCQSYTIVT